MRQMIDVGKQVRYNRIVNPATGKSVIIPLDHGIIMGPVRGVENPALTVRKVVAGKCDAVAFNAGMAQHLYPEYMNRCGSILVLTNMIADDTDHALISTVAYALRNGADAVSVQVLAGSPHECHMLENLGIVADECSRWGVPLLAMMYWAGPKLEGQAKLEALMHTARAGAELGVDIVKTVYTGDHDSFKALVDSCPAPVVIAGGVQKDSLRAALEVVEDAMSCGAMGVALGRNVWQNADPTAVTAAMVDIVHHGKRVRDLRLPGD